VVGDRLPCIRTAIYISRMAASLDARSEFACLRCGSSIILDTARMTVGSAGVNEIST
jgi:hypothetical protein